MDRCDIDRIEAQIAGAIIGKAHCSDMPDHANAVAVQLVRHSSVSLYDPNEFVARGLLGSGTRGGTGRGG